MIAAALASRPLQFFSFDSDCSYKDNPLSKQLESISKMLKTLTIGIFLQVFELTIFVEQAYNVLLKFNAQKSTFLEHLQKSIS